MKFINQLNLPRKSASDKARNIRNLSIQQVQKILRPPSAKVVVSNLSEFLQGENLIVKLYFDSDQYYATQFDDAECDRVLAAFKDNIKKFMKHQEGFNMDNAIFAARHGLTKRKETPWKISFRAYIIDWVTPYSEMERLVTIRKLKGSSDGKFDTKVYSPGEQLINCIYACKGGSQDNYDSRVLLPIGDARPLSDYIIQCVTGNEKNLDISKFVVEEDSKIGHQINGNGAVCENLPVIASPDMVIDTKIVEMLNMLKQSRWDDRASWIDIGIILKRQNRDDLYYPIWLKLSQTSRNFSSESDTKKDWDSFKMDYDRKPLGIGSLRRWAYLDDPNAYHRLVADDNDRRWLKGDLGLSEMAAELCSEVLKFDPDQKIWFHFELTVSKWRSVTDATAKKTIGDALRYCMYTVRSEISASASQAVNPDDRNRFEALHTQIGNVIKYVQDNRGLRNILGVGIDMFSHKNFVQKLDTKKHLIGVKNGVIDLKTGKLRDAAPEDMICREINVEYDERADTSFIEKFVLDIMADDQEMAVYLQKLLGYAITGETNEEVFVFFNSCGRNGKSILINSIEDLMRDTGFFIQGNTGLIVNRRVANIDAERAKLNGSRIVVFNELKPDDTISLDDFKALSGGDPIPAAAKYGAPFSLIPYHLPICVTNSMPKLPLVDVATIERCLAIEFPVIFVEMLSNESPSKFRRQRDNDLKRKISEKKISLLRYLVLGAMRWYDKGGLKKMAPKKVKEFTKKYLDDQNDIARLIQTYCLTGEKFRESSQTLLEKLNSISDKQYTSEGLSANMASLGYQKKFAKLLGTRKTVMCYLGIQLRAEDLSEVSDVFEEEH